MTGTSTEKTPTITIRLADKKEKTFIIKITGGRTTINGDIQRSNMQVSKDGFSVWVEAKSIEIVESTVLTETKAIIKQSGTPGVLRAEIPQTWNVGH
jgi:Fe-S cluster assembly iron-binding protein IscA